MALRDNTVSLAVLTGLGTILAGYLLVRGCGSNVPLVPPQRLTHSVSATYDAGHDKSKSFEPLEDASSNSPDSSLDSAVKDVATLYVPIVPIPLEPTPLPKEPTISPAAHCRYSNDGLKVYFIVAESPNADLRKQCGYTDVEATRIVGNTALNDADYRLRRGRGRQAQYQFLQRNTDHGWKLVDEGDSIDLLIPEELKR